MKIIHVVEPLAGGTGTFIKSLVENLPDDYHIIVHGERKLVTPVAEVKKDFAFNNVKFFKWKSAQRSLHLYKDITAFLELFNLLKRLKKTNSVDVIHLHCSKAGFIGRIVCRLLNIQAKVIYTPNGAPFMVGTNKTSNFIYKHLEKFANLFGGQVVCCSPSEQMAYISAGINSITINNGIQYEKKISSLLRKRKVNNEFCIVTSGRIVDQKNPALFNEIAQYFQEFKQFKFVWIGDGTDRKLLTSSNIEITGWLNKEAVEIEVKKGDIYLSTANFEGLPFAVLEALVLLKPVLLTDCIGNKDLVIKGLNGDIFKTVDEAINKILQYYNNFSMLAVMGRNSELHCETSFNLIDTHHSYKMLYQKALYNQKETHSMNLNHLAWNKMKTAR